MKLWSYSWLNITFFGMITTNSWPWHVPQAPRLQLDLPRLSQEEALFLPLPLLQDHHHDQSCPQGSQ